MFVNHLLSLVQQSFDGRLFLLFATVQANKFNIYKCLLKFKVYGHFSYAEYMPNFRQAP